MKFNFLIKIRKLFKRKEKNPTVALSKAVDEAKKYKSDKNLKK